MMIPEIRPQFHTYVDDRAVWDEITDDLPQYREAWSEDAKPVRRSPHDK